jgi:hypothetical protein
MRFGDLATHLARRAQPRKATRAQHTVEPHLRRLDPMQGHRGKLHVVPEKACLDRRSQISRGPGAARAGRTGGRGMDVAAALLSTDKDAVIAPDGTRLAFGTLLAGWRLSLPLDDTVIVKDPARYRVVGRPAPRVDLPAKATGMLTFVHDMRVPGMLHGRVVRPPYAGHDCGAFVGTSLIDVDRASVERMAGVRGVVVIGDFAKRLDNELLIERCLFHQ